MTESMPFRLNCDKNIERKMFILYSKPLVSNAVVLYTYDARGGVINAVALQTWFERNGYRYMNNCNWYKVKQAQLCLIHASSSLLRIWK